MSPLFFILAFFPRQATEPLSWLHRKAATCSGHVNIKRASFIKKKTSKEGDEGKRIEPWIQHTLQEEQTLKSLECCLKVNGP